jgi:hypothetical protein
MRTLYLILLALISLHVGNAQGYSAVIAHPYLGYAYDASRGAIRPLSGVPGAAIMGAPLDLRFRLAAAAISPRQDFALAVSAADNQVRLIVLGPRMAGANPVVTRAMSHPDLMTLSASGSAAVLYPRMAGASPLVTDAMPHPDLMTFSASGSAAVLYQKSPARLQILTGLPDSPAVQEVNAGLVANPPVSLAVSDDGELVLMAPEATDSDPVWLLTAQGASLRMLLPGSTGAVSFYGGAQDALAATRSGDIYLVRNAGSSPDVRLIRAGDDQTSEPIAIQFSADGKQAYTANARGFLSTVDLLTGSASSISCQCQPVGLQPLQSGTLFRLTDVTNLPVMLFEPSKTEPRIWFVPLDAYPALPD